MAQVTKQYLKNKKPKDHAWAELIDYIFPIVYYLHQEYLNSNAGADGEYKWKKNVVDLDVKMVTALGHGHEMHGYLSTILGNYGNITRAYRETILGSFATDLPGSADLWVPDDRLWEVGMGADADHRAFALRQYKNGFMMLANALAVSAFSSDEMLPVNGAIQYINQRLELYFSENWHQLAFLSDIPADSWEVFIDFETVEAFTYTCPYALKFTSMQHQQPNAPALSVALGTAMAKYDELVITPDAVGLVTLIGEKL